MALPKLNALPEYECKVPSTGKVVKFRPFLVKEQKVLLIALESQDVKEMARAILNTLDACFVDVSVKELTTFDVDYMFSQLRAKSVGETSEFRAACAHCEEYNDVNIRLDKIKLDIEGEIEAERKVEVNEDITIILKYPSYGTLLEKSDTSLTGVDTMFEMILMCIDTVLTEDERIVFKEEPRDEQEAFVGRLSPAKFKLLMSFAQSIPKVTHQIEFECEKCHKSNVNHIQGLENFF